MHIDFPTRYYMRCPYFRLASGGGSENSVKWRKRAYPIAAVSRRQRNLGNTSQEDVTR
ncbi:hypothetical protein AB7M37_005838 [Sinorhizobium fredii]